MTEQEFRASVNQEITRMTDIRKDYPEYARCDDHYDAQGRRCILHKYHDSPHQFDHPEYGPLPPVPRVAVEPEPTLWDYYAMAALTGLLAAESEVGEGCEERTADSACIQADAMMEARAKRLRK